MELLIAVGWYRTICTLCNALDLPVEGWMRAWPASALERGMLLHE